MSTRIPTATIVAAYTVAKQVYQEQLQKKLGITQLKAKYGLNENSAADFINNFDCFMNGRLYQRTLSAEATDYFLTMIQDDFGDTARSLATSALAQHIHYYESLRSTQLAKLRCVLEKFRPQPNGSTEFPNEVDNDTKHWEGAVKMVIVNRYERDPKARQKCLDHHGYGCSICGFKFGEVWGSIGDSFIHVHHLREISTIGREYQVDPVEDLRPVCPNCHAMVHQRKPAYSIDELKALLHVKLK